MFSVLTFLAVFLMSSVSCGIVFVESPFSTATKTTRHSFDSASRFWFGAISSMFFRAFFRALNLM